MKRIFICLILSLISDNAFASYVCPGPYEIHSNCKDPCPPTCKSLYSLEPLPLCIPQSPCPPGCNCMPGYVRNDNNICVLKSQCPIPKCPNPNEIYEPKSKLCPETCESYQKLIPEIPCISPPPLYPLGCKCLPGFVRNKLDICVKPSDCPPPIVCGFNEEADFCPKPCKPGKVNTCAQYLSNTPEECPTTSPNPLCVPRCKCADGFLRKENGLCVKPEDCCDDPNEIAVECPDPCPETCDNHDVDPKPPCHLKCKPKGCICRKGYVRNSDGKCIPKEQCPLKCNNETEILNACPGPCQTDDTCQSILNNTIIICDTLSIIPVPCTQRCFCKPGLVRIGDQCVSPNQCCPDPNSEETVDCPTNCEDTCEGSPPADCTITCPKKRCRCKSGHVRNKIGECIPIPSCPKCSDPNEVYKFCETACEASCDEPNPVCTKPCVEGCFCIPGFVRHKKKCIPIGKCPLKCNEGEVFNPCVPFCSIEDTCPIIFGKLFFDCSSTPPPDYECPMKCECQKGLVRIGNRCVSPNQCCKNPNTEEIHPSPVPCDETCEGKPEVGCVIDIDFKMGCRCKEGHVRNIDKECVLPRECPTCNGTKEVYKFCSCMATCDNPTGACSEPCTEGCFCEPGRVRHNDQCILPSECPPKCLENEVLNLCTAQCTSDNDCKSLLNPTPNVCIPITPPPPCKAKCECKVGYVRDGDKCIPQDQCCRNPELEQIVNCSTPCDQNCEGNVEANCICINARCACRNGYVRNVAGVCIPSQNCPKCTGDNEVYKMNGIACPVSCDTLNSTCTEQRVEGCFCRDGYVRHKNKCILIDDCPWDCKANEVFNPCAEFCSSDLSCARLLDGEVTTCPPKEPKCKKRCECLPGFVRIGENCVSPDQCCNDPTTEVAVSCPALCDETCDDSPLPNCTISRCSIKGCKCKPGLVRDANNKCIPPNKCPPKCTEPHEEFNPRGSNCPPTCDDRSPVCVDQQVKGCFCKEGYIRHLEKCIPIKKCPPRCADNEVLVECPAYCSFDEDCSSLISGIIKDCGPPPLDYDCIPKCFCKPGYVRDGSLCVLNNQCCPSPSTQNVFDCSVPCHATCSDIPDPACVNQNCVKNRCLCKDGYANSTEGVCIPKPSCPAPCTNPNEEFKSCGSKCPPTCYNRTPTCTKDCQSGCFCKEGFIKHLEQCIPIDDCPLNCTVPNEEFKLCGSCDATCDNINPICAAVCKKGCFCKPGYVRHEGACILPTNCTVKCTGPNEKYDSCGSACPANCTNRVKVCPDVCVPGCFCEPGYIRNNEICIKIEKCPILCNRTNEEFTDCGTCDPTCENPDLQCKIPCQLGCFCKKGYVRNILGQCVLPSTCPKKCTGINEEYQLCGSPCPPTCTKRKPTCYQFCQPGCYCKKGFIKKNGVCVKLEECSCKSNEVYSTCRPKVEPFCGCSTSVPSTVCQPGCVCATGYIRSCNDTNSFCVLPSKCPK